MKKLRLINLAIMLLTTWILSGCLLWPLDEGHRGEGDHREHKEHHNNDEGYRH